MLEESLLEMEAAEKGIAFSKIHSLLLTIFPPSQAVTLTLVRLHLPSSCFCILRLFKFKLQSYGVQSE